jgi:anti-sigma-K factor RskA
MRRSLHQLAAPYVLDALESRERRRFERHLDRCDSCTDEVDALRAGAVRLAQAVSLSPPPELADRVFAAIRVTPQESGIPGHEPRRASFADPVLGAARGGAPTGWDRLPSGPPARPRRRLLLPLTAGLAALSMVAAALLGTLYLRTTRDLVRERAVAQAVVQVLAAPDAKSVTESDVRGRGMHAIVSAGLERAVVTLTGVAEPADGRVHQLWLMEANDDVRSLGLVRADDPLVATGIDRTSQGLAVTVEPAGGSARPTSAPIVQVALESAGFGG